MGKNGSFCFHVLWVRILLMFLSISIHLGLDSLATNIIVSSMLVLGGSATVTDLTGMSTIAVGIHMVHVVAA
jgi:hypothetical protein